MHRITRLGLIGGTALTLLVATPGTASATDRDANRHERSHDDGRRQHQPKASNAFRVTTTADTADAEPGDGACADARGRCSLRAAVQEANADQNKTTIHLRARTHALAIAGTGEDAGATGDLDVTSPILLESRGATLDAQEVDRAFDVHDGGLLYVKGLHVTGGRTTGGADPIVGSGAGYRNAGSLVLIGGRVTGNVADGPLASGGGVLNTGVARIEGTTIAGNTATRAGGGIEANGGTTTIEHAKLVSNVTGPTPGNGGGLHLTGAGQVSVHRSEVRDNVAAAEGGGLWNSATGTMEVDRTVLTGNVASGADADQGGGALFNEALPDGSGGGTLTVTRSTITGNRAEGASGSGGGILNDQGTLVVDETTIEGNQAMRAGGGIEANIGSTTLDRVELVGNSTGAAPGNGGGLHITGAGDATIDRSIVTGNHAALEGGGLWNGSGTMRVDRTAISANVASGAAADDGGGGVFNNLGTLEVTRSTITDNRAEGAAGSGGGVFNNDGSATLSETEVTGNRANRAGGGIEALAGHTRLDRVQLLHNDAGATPGNGGGFHLTGAGEVDLDRSTVKGNRAGNEGGGLWNSSEGRMTAARSIVTDNAAPVGPNVFTQPGGALVVNGATVPSGQNDLAFR